MTIGQEFKGLVLQARSVPKVFCQSLECLKGFVAHMVLDTLGITGGGLRIDTDSHEEAVDDAMTPPAPKGERFPLVGEKDRAIGLCVDQSLTLEAGDGAIHRGARDTQTLGKIHSTRFALGRDQIGNELDIILGYLGAVVLTDPVERGGLLRGLR